MLSVHFLRAVFQWDVPILCLLVDVVLHAAKNVLGISEVSTPVAGALGFDSGQIGFRCAHMRSVPVL